MSVPIRLDIPAMIIFVGIVLGFLLSFSYLFRSSKRNSGNLFMGLLLLTFTMNMIEGWLNYTNLIFKVLHLTNFSEPTNFIIAPLLYFFVSRQLGEQKSAKEWLHYIPFFLWIICCIFFYIQSEEFKYNSNISAMQLDIPMLDVTYDSSDNPFGIRSYVNELTMIQIFLYAIVVFRKLLLRVKSIGESLLRTKDRTIVSLRSSVVHFVTLFLVLVTVKVFYTNDAGDYWIYVYLSFLLLLNLIQALSVSNYFDQPSTFLEFPSLKYQKSSLLEEQKIEIVRKLEYQIEEEQYFLKSAASLSDLSKKIQESKHNVSQVLNEKMGGSFFELMAKQRVEEAQRLLKSEEGKKLTIEEISERVGYNSKSAFNLVFKRLTSQTPSAYRSSK